MRNLNNRMYDLTTYERHRRECSYKVITESPFIVAKSLNGHLLHFRIKFCLRFLSVHLVLSFYGKCII